MRPRVSSLLILLPAVAALNASIVYGVLYLPGQSPKTIGNLTSAVSSALTDVFGSISPNSSVILKNSSSFYSYLALTGEYDADAPIFILPSVSLVLTNAHIVVRADFNGDAVLNATDAAWSSVVSPGGPEFASIVCPQGGPAPVAVVSAQSSGFIVDGLTVNGCGAPGAAIWLHGKPFATGGEVANCRISNAPSRSIWTETIRSVAIHGNTINNSAMHTIDFDAFSASSVCYNNSVSFSGEEAVFIEQSASNIVVVDNDLGPGNSRGVAIYNNAMSSPTVGHVIARNRIFGCSAFAIGVGSGPGRTHADTQAVLVFGNTLYNNNGTGIHTNGPQEGTVYIGNDDSDGLSLYTLAAGTYKNISIADPLDRVRVGNK